MQEPTYPDFSKEIQPKALDVTYIQERIDFELPKWRIIKSPLRENTLKEEVALFRLFEFESFKKVGEFICDMENIAGIVMHHPRLENMYTSLEVYLSTWGIDHRISFKDILFAKNLDKIYTEKYVEIDAEEMSISKDYIESLKEMIGECKLQDALENLNDYIVMNKSLLIPKDLIILKKRSKDLNSKLITGVISHSDFSIEENKISYDFLELLNKLTE